MKRLIFCLLMIHSVVSLGEPIKSMLGSEWIEMEYDKEGIVPIEYLESTGTQWIDTRILGSTSYDVIAVYFQPIFKSENSKNYFFGAGNDSSNGFGFRLYYFDGNVFTTGFGWTKTLQYWNRQLIEEPQSVKISFSEKLFTVNGSGGNTLSFRGTYDYNFIIFGRSVGDVVEPCKPIRIYEVQIGETTFIPVRIGHEGFMLELPSGELHGNQGYGRFVLGPDMED